MWSGMGVTSNYWFLLYYERKPVPFFIIINPALNVFEISRALGHRII